MLHYPIYDRFRESSPLSWGPVAHKDAKWCNGIDFQDFERGDVLFPKRGSIVGVDVENSMKIYREI